jgi:hypothetical protein
MAMIGVIIGGFITVQAGLGYIIMFASSAGETATVLAAIDASDRHFAAIPPLHSQFSLRHNPVQGKPDAAEEHDYTRFTQQLEAPRQLPRRGAKHRHERRTLHI